MQTRIQKWGNSLALRIPKALANEIGLSQNSAIELTLEKGRLIIAPISAHRFELEDLLAGVSVDNLHSEVGTGSVVGNETW